MVKPRGIFVHVMNQGWNKKHGNLIGMMFEVGAVVRGCAPCASSPSLTICLRRQWMHVAAVSTAGALPLLRLAARPQLDTFHRFAVSWTAGGLDDIIRKRLNAGVRNNVCFARPQAENL